MFIYDRLRFKKSSGDSATQQNNKTRFNINSKCGIHRKYYYLLFT